MRKDYVQPLKDKNNYDTKVDKPNKFFVCDFYKCKSFGPFSSLDDATSFIKDNNLTCAQVVDLLKDYEIKDVSTFPISVNVS